MSSVQRIFKNSAVLAGGRILTKAGSLIFLGFVTRALGEEDFGRFSSAMALVGFVAVLPNYVARPFIIRYAAREREKSGDFISGVLATNFFLSIMLFASFFAVVPFLGYAADAQTAAYILAFSLLFSSMTNSYHALFYGRERMEYSTMTDVFNTLLTIAFGVMVLVFSGGVVELTGAYLLARVATFFYAMRLGRRLCDDKSFRMPSAALMRSMFTGAWPFFITQLFIVFYNRADIVMLSFMDSVVEKEIAVGRYNTAYKLMEALGLVTSAFVMSVYPVLARKFMKGAGGVLTTFRKSLRVLVAVTMPVAVGTTILAEQIMGNFFGKPFAVAGAALQILIWGQVMDSINPLNAATMRALGREKDLARITGVCAVFNVALNIILIPRYSYMGAAVATLLSFLLVYAWSYFTLRKALGKLAVFGIIARAALAAIIMGVAVWWTAQYGLLVAIPTGIIVYILAAFGCGVVGKEDVQLFARLIQKKG
jgi:O-antigen/teichoic acid export membrane protein